MIPGSNSIFNKYKTTAKGFTIVELLIVIVVIAILAAITIVAYNGIQDRANDTTVQSDLGSLSKKFELYRVDGGGFPLISAELLKLEFRASKSAYMIRQATTYNLVPCITTDGVDYAIGAISKSGKRYYVGSKSGGVREFTGPNDWKTTAGYSTICGDILAGSSLPTGGGSPGYGDAWRAWVK